MAQSPQPGWLDSGPRLFAQLDEGCLLPTFLQNGGG